MTYNSLKEQLNKVKGGMVSTREDENFKDNGIDSTFLIVEFVVTDYDLFYEYIPPFAEHIFYTQCVKKVIARFCQRGIPYTISFPVEFEK